MTGDDQTGRVHVDVRGGLGDVPGSAPQQADRALISVLEQEQRRLARSIHDGPAQVLANLALQSEIIERLIGVDNARAVQEVRELRREALRAAREMRQMIDQVAPPGLLQRDLIGLLKEHADRFERQFGLRVDVDAASDLAISTFDQVTLFRVIQEALQNVLRHSSSRRAWVRIHGDGHELVAEVQDEGTGFNPDDTTAQDGVHLGIAGMRERAQLAGGTLLVESAPSAGTRVTLRLPR